MAYALCFGWSVIGTTPGDSTYLSDTSTGDGSSCNTNEYHCFDSMSDKYCVITGQYQRILAQNTASF